MPRYVALLRAINLGAKRKVPMADLRAVLSDLGYENVRTYVQSGNAVFDAPGKPAALVKVLEPRLEEAFGFAIPVIVRTRDELAAIVAHDPLAAVATEPKRYQVLFLAGKLDRSRVADLDPDDFAPETFAVDDRELYVWSPEGVQNSPLLKALSDKRIGVAATSRNWRTVTKLLELAHQD
jgi:uncharacterized protein (DUF1697 family)